jgi:hypothetical protein
MSSGLVEPEVSMRAMLQASVVAVTLALSAGTAAAARKEASRPLPLDPSSEFVVGVVNTCATAADVRIVIKDATDGSVLRGRRFTVAAKRGVFLTYHSNASVALLVANIVVTCAASSTQRAVQPRPLTGIVVRDWQTKAPRFIGDSMDGNNI